MQHPNPDIRHITSGYLIREIDLAFRAWQENFYSRSIPFEDFCEYVLPYRRQDSYLLEDFKRRRTPCYPYIRIFCIMILMERVFRCTVYPPWNRSKEVFANNVVTLIRIFFRLWGCRLLLILFRIGGTAVIPILGMHWR